MNKMDFMQDETLLLIKNLKTYFYMSQGFVRAVDGVDFVIPKQTAVGLVGESGCGKSATALSIMRLLPSPPSKIIDGEIFYKGNDLLKLSNKELRKIRGREISMVFQDPLTFLNPVFKVGNQIHETIMEHYPDKKTEINKKVLELLERVGIADPLEVMEYYPHQLSGGMRQRIIIAIALSCNPSMLILDEPTTSLDVTIQRQILELIKDLKEEFKMSIMLITHDLGIVAEICDFVYIMYAGRIMEHANIYTIFENAKHPYTRGLLKSVLSIDEHKKELVGIDGNVPDMMNLPLGCKFHPRCIFKKDICIKEEPPLIEVEPGHYLRCWLK
ncbi:unnamed protein product [marine sediment metagenome]|uniref:ABC transporter domain-containing protein n=1 Tax=marine sediment metagenome TaxID=412755 RepID=X0ZWA2_9ZZZZ